MTKGSMVCVFITQILEGPFSAVSKPMFATEELFCSIFEVYKIDMLLHRLHRTTLKMYSFSQHLGELFVNNF